MRWMSGFVAVCAVMILTHGSARAGEKDTVPPIAMPQADRNAIEALLGTGVIGDALPGRPLPVSSRFLPVQDATWIFRFVSGKHKGKTQKDVFTPLQRDKSGKSGHYSAGAKTVFFFRESDDGDLVVVSEQDLHEGVIIRFSPSEPIILSGMQPGSGKQTKTHVKVYDLSQPNDLMHSGTLDLTYSYVGAYRVTVPAGTYDTALIKWHYKGNVGPANVEDTQYRFFAEGTGPVALIDKSDISAFLIYQDHSKHGKVLVERK